MQLTQRDLYTKVKGQTIATRERITELVRKLDAAQLLQRPEPNSWSVGEVLEHLCVSDELFDAPTRKAVASARADATAPLRQWKSTLFAGLVAWSLENPRKLKAPSVFRPGPSPRTGVLEAFRRIDQSVVELMDRAEQLDWRAVKIHSPALPSWMPAYNLGDVFRIHSIHTTRHAAQIERAIAKL
jgi:hypothetical protein